jgi:MFS transporter, SET family, sugar efflux transporter
LTSVALRGRLRTWYPLGLVFLAVGLSVSMSYPFLTLFLTDTVHADPVHVTIYLVVGPVAGIVFTQLIARRSDRRPARRRLLIGAGIAGVAAMSLNAFVRDYWLLLGVAVTLTAVAGSMMSQGFAYAQTVLAGSDRAAMTTSMLRALFSLAWVAGPPIAALIQSTAGFSALYLAAAGTYAVALIVTLAMLPEPADSARSLAAGPSGTPGTPGTPGTRLVRSDPPVRLIACTIAAFTLLQGAARVGTQMLPLFLRADLHSGVRQAGLMLGLCAGLEIPLMMTFGAVSTRLTSRRLILLGALCSGAYLLLVSGATHTWMLFAGQIVNATSIAAIQGLGVSYVNDLMPGRPGQASALYGNSFAAGTILSAPLIAGAQGLGYRAAYLIAAGICLAGFLLMAIGRPPRRTAPVVQRPAEQVAST